MKHFECQNCRQFLHFEDTRCERCGHMLGYLPDRAVLSALTSENLEIWRPLAAPGEKYRICANARYGTCNWLVPAEGENIFCRACQLNRTIPDLDQPGNNLLWRRLEAAKHRLVYSLLSLGLPLSSRREDIENGLVFDFVANSATAFQDGSWIVPGHAHGVITIDLAEADDAKLERNRRYLVQPCRTLLGHFRHEVGHHYWERFIKNGVWHGAFRQMFGDERQDYRSALLRHYSHGPQGNWKDRSVSSYACIHPWEDFAETWAYYLNMIDMLETASSFGLLMYPSSSLHPMRKLDINFDAYHQGNFDELMAAWLSLTYAVNCFSRGMGQPDLYPFVPAPAIVGKLRFINGLIHSVVDLFAQRIQESSAVPSISVSQ